MTIALIVGKDEAERNRWQWFIKEWQEILLSLDPSLDIRIFPDINQPEEVQFALVWRYPYGVLKQFPNLKGVAALGAGVDYVLSDPELRKDVPIARLVDPYMASEIMQYVVAAVLHHVKRLDQWERDQQKKLWERRTPFNYNHKTIGIMGLGFLGKKTALALQYIDLNVIGWSQSPKQITNVKTFSGQSEFYNFLAETDILVCMLPLTAETKNILNKDTFSHLPKDAFLINMGRGDQLVEEDLISALNSGHLSGAFLDVFKTEPLPPEHPFWTHSQIQVTPHIASVTHAETAAPQVLENYYRAIAGKELLNRVNIAKGY